MLSRLLGGRSERWRGHDAGTAANRMARAGTSGRVGQTERIDRRVEAGGAEAGPGDETAAGTTPDTATTHSGAARVRPVLGAPDPAAAEDQARAAQHRPDEERGKPSEAGAEPSSSP